MNVEDFDVSPSGKYIAFTRSRKRELLVCVSEVGGIAECVPMTPGGAYDIFVSDLGEVLYTTDLNENCGGTPCSGVAHWRVGMYAPEIIDCTTRILGNGLLAKWRCACMDEV